MLADIIACALLFAAILAVDLIPTIKKKNIKVIVIYSSIYIFTLTINILYGLGFDIPSPADPIKKIISSIFGQK